MTEPNNAWLQFLVQHGARLSASEPHDVIDFQDKSIPSSQTEGFIHPLLDLGLTQASGEDAARFLHSQLTNDVEHISPADARLAGYCSPKGRLLATMLLWKTNGALFLQLPREIQPAIQKRLQMFVLRSKVTLTDVSQQYAILGLAGEKTQAALTPWFAELPSTPYAKVDTQAGTLIRVADAQGMPRYQWIASVEMAQQAWPQLVQQLSPQGGKAWRLRDIQAGIPQITRATQEQFVPQMINFEAIGGVSFKKGCYPGQEIVARSQYLGKLKRRMMRASLLTQEKVLAGTEVFSSSDPDQPCGMVVNAEPVSATQTECLVEIKTGMLENGRIHLGSVTGPALEFHALPYSLPDSA